MSMRGSRGREGVGTTKLEEGTGTDELSGKSLFNKFVLHGSLKP